VVQMMQLLANSQPVEAEEQTREILALGLLAT
jgi:hypothetical protein